MSHKLQIPAPELDDSSSSREPQEYKEEQWSDGAVDEESFSVPDWHREVIAARLKADPNLSDSIPWE